MKKIKSWLIDYRYHFLAWSLLIAFEVLYMGFVYSLFRPPFVYALHYALLISVFYCHYMLILPWSLKGRMAAVFKVPLGIVLEMAIFISLCALEDNLLELLHQFGKDKVTYDMSYVWSNMYRALYFVVYATGYYFIVTYFEERRKTAELERQRLEEIIVRQETEQALTRSQNAFLKAQINPHFLFNTLDFIYHHIISISPVSADAIIALSDMMRYAIDSDKMGETIKIGDEIEQVYNLLYLNQLRKSGEQPVTITCDKQFHNLNFIPLVLLTLVENIIKHGELSPEKPARLEVNQEGEYLIIESENSISRKEPVSGHRTGLNNIGRRLDYAYNGTALFNYRAIDGNFLVTIKVPVEKVNGGLPLKAISAEIDKV